MIRFEEKKHTDYRRVMLEKKQHWNLKYQTQDPTNIKKPDYTLVKYLRVLYRKRPQKQFFFLIYCKKITNFVFWVL